MKILRGFSGERGFTLLEVVIAVGVFMVGMAGVGMMMASTVKGNKFSYDLWSSNNLATNELERLMTLPRADAALNELVGANLVENFAAGLDDGSIIGPVDTTADFNPRTVGRFSVFYNVAAGVPAPNCRTFRVFVQWQVKDQLREIRIDGIRIS